MYPQGNVTTQNANAAYDDSANAAATADYLENASPSWLADLIKARHEQGRTVFLLHFNIRDLVFDPAHPPASPAQLLEVKDFLSEMLSSRDAVLYYSLHSGISTYSETHTFSNKPFRARDMATLWSDIAADASMRPFRLMPEPNRFVEEPAPPDSWRLPTLAIRLLSRALTTGYTLQASQSAPAFSSGAAAGRVAPGDGNNGESHTGQPSSVGPAHKSLSLGIIVDYLHHLAPSPGTVTRHEVTEIIETFQRWSTDVRLREQNHLVMMLVPELAALHPELQTSDSRIQALRIDRPDRENRAAFLLWLSRFPEYRVINEQRLVDELANRTSGMNYIELRDFAGNVQRTGGRAWEELLAAQRAEIVQRASGGLLVPKESKHGLDSVAGYRYVREYVERLLPKLRQGRGDVSGVLFTGPPGTGKSFYASALARDAGMNVVVMRNLRNMYVGQSERNLEQVLEVARTLAPVIIFVDEIDQAFASRQHTNSNDSGVEQRLLGRLLEFIDDKQNLGKVLWLAASNRPDLIDDALLSRFKLRIPFLLPDQEACRELLITQLPRQAGFQWRPGTWNAAQLEATISSKVVSRYSGRELDTIVRRALWKAEDANYLNEAAAIDPVSTQGRGWSGPDRSLAPETAGVIEVDACFLFEAIEDASVGHDDVEYLRQSLLALRWMPSSSKTLVEAVRTSLPQRHAERIITSTGEIDKDEINRLLRELESYNVWGSRGNSR